MLLSCGIFKKAWNVLIIIFLILHMSKLKLRKDKTLAKNATNGNITTRI